MVMLCATFSVGQTAVSVENLSSCVENFFRLPNSVAYSFLAMRYLITYVFFVEIASFLRAGAFWNLSILMDPNEKTSIKVILCRQRNSISSESYFCGVLASHSSPIGPVIFCRPKNFFKKFSNRPWRQRLYRIAILSFFAFHEKSIQNGSRGHMQHLWCWRLISKCSKTVNFALFVKERGQKRFIEIRVSRKKVL